jgi:hypothetical protein
MQKAEGRIKSHLAARDVSAAVESVFLRREDAQGVVGYGSLAALCRLRMAGKRAANAERKSSRHTPALASEHP